MRAADWSHDSSHVVTGGKEAKVRLFDLNKPEAEPQLCTGHSALIKVVKYLPDPNLVITGGEDKTLVTWDVRTLTEARKLTFGGSVNSVELSQDGGEATPATPPPTPPHRPHRPHCPMPLITKGV